MMNKLKQAKTMLALACTLLAPGALVVGVGCSGGGCAQLAPGQDALVVRAEQTAETALNSFLAFDALEARTRTVHGNAALTKAADEIRQNGVTWIEGLLAAKETYKASGKTPATRSKLLAAQAVVDGALAIATGYTGE